MPRTILECHTSATKREDASKQSKQGNNIEGKEDEIKADIINELGAEKVEFEKGIALIAVVGEGMCYKPGIIAKVSTALANDKININIISQGGSERSIILGVDVKDYKSAMQTLYRNLLAKR